MKGSSAPAFVPSPDLALRVALHSGGTPARLKAALLGGAKGPAAAFAAGQRARAGAAGPTRAARESIGLHVKRFLVRSTRDSTRPVVIARGAAPAAAFAAAMRERLGLPDHDARARTLLGELVAELRTRAAERPAGVRLGAVLVRAEGARLVAVRAGAAGGKAAYAGRARGPRAQVLFQLTPR